MGRRKKAEIEAELEAKKAEMETCVVKMDGHERKILVHEGECVTEPKHEICAGSFSCKYKHDAPDKFIKKDLMNVPQETQEVLMATWIAQRTKPIRGMDVHPEDYVPIIEVLKDKIFRKKLRSQPKLTQFDKDKELVTGKKQAHDSEKAV